MDLLDEVCGQDNWQSEFYEVRGTMFCRVGINVDGKWVFKSDAGSKPDESSGDDAVVKGEPSDAFKRACVQWGIGRFLYSQDMVWIDAAEYAANRFKITEFCNGKKSGNNNHAPTTKEDNKQWMNEPELKVMRENKSFFPTADSALKAARLKYKVSKEMAMQIEELYEDAGTSMNEQPF